MDITQQGYYRTYKNGDLIIRSDSQTGAHQQYNEALETAWEDAALNGSGEYVIQQPDVILNIEIPEAVPSDPVEPTPVDPVPVDPPVTVPGDMSYFEKLVARSDVHIAVPFRSQEDVDEYTHKNNQDVDYDAERDAMRFTWPAAHGSNVDQAQVSIEPAIVSGTAFVSWEAMWSPEWLSDGQRNGVNGISTFKDYQISDKPAFTSGGLQMEIRKQNRKSFLTDEAVPEGTLGYIDIRSYFAAQGGVGGRNQFPGIERDFLLHAYTWARYDLFIDYAGNGEVSLWVSEPGVDPVAVYERAPGAEAGDPGPFRSFWFEHNSSKTYSGPKSHVWNRNFVVLNGVASFEDALSLVLQG